MVFAQLFMNINLMNKTHQPYSHSKSRVVSFEVPWPFNFVLEPSLLGGFVTKPYTKSLQENNGRLDRNMSKSRCDKLQKIDRKLSKVT